MLLCFVIQINYDHCMSLLFFMIMEIFFNILYKYFCWNFYIKFISIISSTFLQTRKEIFYIYILLSRTVSHASWLEFYFCVVIKNKEKFWSWDGNFFHFQWLETFFFLFTFSLSWYNQLFSIIFLFFFLKEFLSLIFCYLFFFLIRPDIK